MAIATSSKHELTLEDIQPLVWQPSFESCRTLLESLSDLSISIDEVDERFSGQRNTIETQLQLLSRGVNDCTRTTEKIDHLSIDRAILRIRYYWELRQYREGANIFLRIRDTLHLPKEGFSLVEKLSREVN